MVEENSLLSYRVTVPTNSILFPLSFLLQFSDLSGLFSFILEAIKRCFNPMKQIKRCFPNQNLKGKKKIMNANNLEIDLSNAGSEQLLENPKARNKKESKPIQQKKLTKK